MKPRGRRGREAWLLGRVYRFCHNHGWWPSAVEMVDYTGRGSRWTARRDLVTLRGAELVKLERKRWMVTVAGCEYLGLPVLTARLLRRPKHVGKRLQRVTAERESKVRRSAAFEVFERPEGLDVVD